MNYKRKGPKSTRAGCLLCKPHKRQGTKAAGRRGNIKSLYGGKAARLNYVAYLKVREAA